MSYTDEQIRAAHADMESAVSWSRVTRDYEDLRNFVERRIEEDEQAAHLDAGRIPFKQFAECEAKRSLLEGCGTYPTEEGERILKILARIYRLHPHYESEWV